MHTSPRLARVRTVALLVVASVCLWPAAAARSQPAARSALGMNTDALTYWGPSVPLIDEIKGAGAFGSPSRPSDFDEPDSPQYDEWGWPTDDFGVYIGSGRPIWPGVHKIICGGKVDSIRTHASPGQMQNLAYDAAANVTTAEVVVPSDSNQLVLVFRGTQRNPADAAEGKGVKWVKVLCPGYDSDTTPETGPFTREYVKAWQPFGHVRLMALNQTNSHPVATWGERSKTQEAQWSSRRGVPWEIQLELSRRAGVAPWICVPHLADDAYVVELARLARASLPPGMPVYVESSNEVWNATLGTQYGHNKQAAEAEVASGDPNGYTKPVTYFNPKFNQSETMNTTGRDVWLWFRQARRSAHVAKIFQDVFGPGEAYRVRGILGLQNSDDWRSSVTLAYVARQLGPPSHLFFATAIAPYYGSDNQVLLKNPDATPAQLAEWAKESGVKSFDLADGKPARHKRLADHWGLKMVGYEGGLDWDQNKINLAAKLEAMGSPLAGEGNTAYYTGAFQEAGFVMFNGWMCGRYGQWGWYAETNDIRNLSTPRYLASSAAATQFRLPDPDQPDSRDQRIRDLLAQNHALQAEIERRRSKSGEIRQALDTLRERLAED